jgi:adenylate cyclase
MESMALSDWSRDGRSTLLAATLGIGLGVSSGVSLARSGGWLEGLELPAYDRFVRWRVDAAATPRVAIVRIREEDIAEHGHPLPDAVLTRALRGIAAREPRAIGVDLYREAPRPGEPRADYDAFAAFFAADDRLFLIEKLPQPGDPGVPAPAFARGSGRVGFSDIAIDSDGVVRRGLLILWDEEDRPSLSLALLLALRALREDGLTLEPDPEQPDYVRLGDTTIRPLEATTGDYARADPGGYQFLLDLSAGSALPTYDLADVLAGRVPEDAFRDRVVLVGTTSHSVKDDFVSAASGGGLIHGVVLHAEAVDQLLRVARDGAAPTRSWSDAAEWVWIFALGIAGGALAFVIPNPLALAVGVVSALGALLLFAAGSFAIGVWVPWVSPGLATLASSGLVLAERSRRERAERRAVMDLFGRFVSRRVADELWRRRAEFMHGGRPRPQRLVITAMLTDLKGYTQAAESMDATALMEWVNEYMDAMTRVIEAHGGFVDDYTGDGIKANWGVPLVSAEVGQIKADARAAVRCALEMGQTLESLSRDWSERGRPIAMMRVGLYTGEAVGGSLGSADRMKYTTVGDTVNTAARLESFHKEDFEPQAGDASEPLFRVLIGGSTRDLLDDDEFEFEDLGDHVLRGRGEAVRIYRVWGRGAGWKETQ